MAKITFHTEHASFIFPYDDFMEYLKGQIDQCEVDEDISLFACLRKMSAEGNRDVLMDAENNDQVKKYHIRISFIIKDLLSLKNGSVFCNHCNSEVPLAEVKIDAQSPLQFNHKESKDYVKLLKMDLGVKGKIRSAGMGITRIFCGRGHLLLSMVDWIE
jgi:hypothetical protein